MAKAKTSAVLTEKQITQRIFYVKPKFSGFTPFLLSRPGGELQPHFFKTDYSFGLKAKKPSGFFFRIYLLNKLEEIFS